MLSVPVGNRFVQFTLGGYARLLFAILVLVVESAVRLVFMFVPQPVTSGLDFVRAHLIRQGVRLFRGYMDANEDPAMDMTTVQLIQHFGYTAEEHIVKTDDRFVLTLHRIPRRKNESHSVNGDRPAVFLMHGLMMCSEVWVATNDSLAFMLADHGFDVWLGNNRGNRYSHKNTKFKPSQNHFWDFSVDELALYDVPANLNYILDLTQQKTLSYVGFSQGTAQAFASFSLNPQLAARVNMFVALAPAGRAKGLKKGVIGSFVRLAPDSIFLMFGAKACMPSALFWRNLLARNSFTSLIDASCRLLFGWRMANFGSQDRKNMLFAHLFSYTSVKTIVHWFQMVAMNQFQMYDENQDLAKTPYRGTTPNPYPVHQIKCPMAIFYGGADGICDVQWLLDQMPKNTFIHRQDEYEHLDLIWAASASTCIFPKVIRIIKETVEREAEHELQRRKREEECAHEIELLERANDISVASANAGRHFQRRISAHLSSSTLLPCESQDSGIDPDL
ncbi:triacylglycerol lipase [Capsaspora owczarzaki ATCC 30864]|nr:triacylglycerol lipase [Capsaspora owczarzaki ATCC 30864]|eukprot:XP_004343698.1 triacylglycerol lipase [Capsaspora owczarzaki ATCC 30864]